MTNGGEVSLRQPETKATIRLQMMSKQRMERSDSKQTGRQTNEHLKYGREFYCTLFRIFTCCKEVHVISKNPSQVKHTIYANQMSI